MAGVQIMYIILFHVETNQLKRKIGVSVIFYFFTEGASVVNNSLLTYQYIKLYPITRQKNKSFILQVTRENLNIPLPWLAS